MGDKKEIKKNHDELNPCRGYNSNEQALFVEILSTYPDDIQKYFNFIRLERYAKENKLPPPSRTKRTETQVIYDIKTIIDGVKSDWTQTLCDLAGVDYSWFRTEMFRLIKLGDINDEIQL